MNYRISSNYRAKFCQLHSTSVLEKYFACLNFMIEWHSQKFIAAKLHNFICGHHLSEVTAQCCHCIAVLQVGKFPLACTCTSPIKASQIVFVHMVGQPRTQQPFFPGMIGKVAVATCDCLKIPANGNIFLCILNFCMCKNFVRSIFVILPQLL